MAGLVRTGVIVVRVGMSNTANYSIELGKNNISAVIGTEAKKENGEHLQGYVADW